MREGARRLLVVLLAAQLARRGKRPFLLLDLHNLFTVHSWIVLREVVEHRILGSKFYGKNGDSMGSQVQNSLKAAI